MPQGKKSDLIRTIPFVKIRMNPHQPRKIFSKQAHEKLVKSIKNEGLIHRPTVRADPERGEGFYMLLAGERRLRALEALGETSCEFEVSKSDIDPAIFAFQENDARDSLHAFDLARFYKDLVNRLGWTQERVGTFVGKNQTHIAKVVGILDLPDKIQEEAGETSFRFSHFYALVQGGVEDDVALEVWELMKAGQVKSANGIQAAKNRILKEWGRAPKEKAQSKTESAKLIRRTELLIQRAKNAEDLSEDELRLVAESVGMLYEYLQGELRARRAPTP